MPTAAPHPCTTPGCAALVPRGHGKCAAHQAQYFRDDAASRGSAAERGYDARWHRLRTRYLGHHPLCAHCLLENRPVPAHVVDHVQPWQRGATELERRRLFEDESNWQSLCVDCNNRKTARERSGGGGG